jgi:hypothetical protein
MKWSESKLHRENRLARNFNVSCSKRLERVGGDCTGKREGVTSQSMSQNREELVELNSGDAGISCGQAAEFIGKLLQKVRAAEKICEARVRAQRVVDWVHFDEWKHADRAVVITLFQPPECFVHIAQVR